MTSQYLQGSYTFCDTKEKNMINKSMGTPKHQRRKYEGSSPNFLREHLGVICFIPKNLSFFLGKRTSYIFPRTRDSQCQNSANSLAENTPNASKNFSPICLPKPKSFEFLKKSSVWVSVVRGRGENL